MLALAFLTWNQLEVDNALPFQETFGAFVIRGANMSHRMEVVGVIANPLFNIVNAKLVQTKLSSTEHKVAISQKLEISPLLGFDAVAVFAGQIIINVP